MKDSKENRDCLECKHLYISWDKDFPNGCKAMGFKSKNVPSVVVYQSSGMPCLRSEPKG